MTDEEKQKKKEYETLKIKRSVLEKVRDVFAVIRDLLLILVLIGLIAVIFIGITLLMNANQILGSIQSGGLGSVLSGVLGGSGGSLPLSISGGKTLPTVKGDASMCALLSDAKNSFLTGDSTTANQKLTQLKTALTKKSLSDQSKTVDKLIQAVNSDDINQIVALDAQLESSIQC